jgi:prolyl-tRNA synthetase
MGALIMTHSDDQGLVLPPKLAPFQVVIVPIYRSDEEFQKVCDAGKSIKQELEKAGISVKLDDRDTHKPGFKFNEHELRGVPVRIAIGPRDLENGTVEIARRDTLEKEILHIQDLPTKIAHLLEQIQQNLYTRALTKREELTFKADSWDEFVRLLDEPGGFIYAHWDGTSETEEKIKELTKATIRCIPLDNKPEAGNCILTGKPSDQRVLFARAY